MGASKNLGTLHGIRDKIQQILSTLTWDLAADLHNVHFQREEALQKYIEEKGIENVNDPKHAEELSK